MTSPTGTSAELSDVETMIRGMEAVDYQMFWRAVTNNGRNRCELADAPCHRCGGTGSAEKPAEQLSFLGSSSAVRVCLRCQGRGRVACCGVIDAHHFVPKRRLATKQAKLDVRNGVTLCREHHELVEQAILRSPRPPLLQFFLAEHDVSPAKVPDAYVEQHEDLGVPA